MGIRVQAFDENYVDGTRKAVGYYDLKRRYHGDTFEIANEKELGKWMRRLDGPTTEPETPPATRMPGRSRRAAAPSE